MRTRSIAVASRESNVSTTNSLKRSYRREWSLAVERAMDFADSVPFIIPVAIDDTAEDADGMPERFLRPQWTRLPGGAGTEAFRRRMVALVREYRRRTHD
jgi:hypothetical protein